MPRRLQNFLAFQAGWLGCVAAAGYRLPLLGLLIAGIVTGWHLWRSPAPRAELKLMIFAMALGTLCDSALLATGWLSFPVGQPIPGIAPYWIIAMWAMFATTLNDSLAWLTRRTLLACFCGAIFAPLAYWAGANMGALILLDPVPALAAIAGAWAAALPILTTAARAFSAKQRTHGNAILSAEVASHA